VPIPTVHSQGTALCGSTAASASNARWLTTLICHPLTLRAASTEVADDNAALLLPLLDGRVGGAKQINIHDLRGHVGQGTRVLEVPGYSSGY
jgi:hypothetical protein